MAGAPRGTGARMVAGGRCSVSILMTESSSIQTIGIVGCGAMGRGIIQIAALAGCRVKMFDAMPGAAHSAKQTLADTLEKLQHKGKLGTDTVNQALTRMVPIESLNALADCELVIEAIVENLTIKRTLFAELEAVLRPNAMLVSNTSSLSITALAAGCSHPERIAGYHFFNAYPGEMFFTGGRVAGVAVRIVLYFLVRDGQGAEIVYVIVYHVF